MTPGIALALVCATLWRLCVAESAVLTMARNVELDAAITRLACVVPRDRVALVEAELIRRGRLLGDELAAVQAVTDDVARGLLW